MRRLIVSFLLFLPIIVASFILYLQSSSQQDKNNIEGATAINRSVSVSASIGGGSAGSGGGGPGGGGPGGGGSGGGPGAGGTQQKFLLYGYTSPSAQVYLEGIGIIGQTTADKNGYFSFENSPSPLLPREACLTAKDQLGRLSSPSCLPAFPISYSVNIGPVLLPPTLSLNKSEYYTGEEIVISGQTIPNTDVILSLFVDPSKKSLIDYLAVKLNPVKSVYAFGFPDLKTKTDDKGNYSLKIPSAKSDLFRLFTRSLYEKQSTPQSNRLSLKILPIWWMLIVNFFIWLWHFLQPHLLEIIIFVQIAVLLIYFTRQYLLPHRLALERAPMVQEKHPLPLHE